MHVDQLDGRFGTVIVLIVARGTELLAGIFFTPAPFIDHKVLAAHLGNEGGQRAEKRVV